MAEDIEEIRRQKLAELRNRTETDRAEESASKSPSETRVTVAKIDIYTNQELAAKYGIWGVPTLVLFADGQPAERLVRTQDESALRSVT